MSLYLLSINKFKLKYTILWFLVFLAFVNPAYLDRFVIFNCIKLTIKVIAFIYFLICGISCGKMSKKLIPWISYAVIPLMTTVVKAGTIKSGLVYVFTIISVALMFFYIKDKSFNYMISGLALLMEMLITINFITLIIFPEGLYLYETDAGWWSRDVWFFGLRNSHASFLYLGCFASTIYCFYDKTKLNKIMCIYTHVISIMTILKLDSGGGIVAFTMYFILVLMMARKHIVKFRPFTLKIKMVVLIHVLIFLFLSFFAGNTSIGNIFSILGEQRVYTFGRRLDIWHTVWEHTLESPIIGSGFMNTSDITWLTRIAAGATTSHNSMIDICFRGGFITLIVYIIMLVSSGSAIDHNKQMNLALKNYISISLMTILLLLQSEGAIMSIPLLVTVGMSYRIGSQQRYCA